MYVAVRRYVMDPKSVNEVMRRIREEFVPIISKAPGFLNYHVLDAGNGVLASISMFENKAEAEESNRLAANWAKTLGSLLPNPPDITCGEVIVEHHPLSI
jgi:quinol monooxygenase YgiN